jgi:UDP-glucose 4-epimerase
MSILITGGAGYIGSHIAEQLINRKYDVIILDNLKTGHEKLIDQKANFIKGDINNKKLVNNIIKQYNIQTIIHLAAYLNVSEVVPLYDNQELYNYFFLFFKKNEFALWSLVPIFRKDDTGELLQFDAVLYRK